MSINTKSVALNCEALERRDNPAGNVAVSMINGNLTLIGDAADNQFRVQQTGSGDLFVFGLNGTLVNGQASLYLGRGILNNLQFDTRQGNDYVEILGVVSRGWVWGITGNENDGVYVGGVTAGRMFLDLQGGNDGLVTSHVRVGGPAELSGGTGVDGYDWDGLFAGGGLFVHDFEVVH